MTLFILRGAFIVLAVVVATLYLLSNQLSAGVGFGEYIVILLAVIGLSLAVVAADSSFRHKRLSAVSGIFLGLVAGLVAAYALSFVVDLVGLLTAPEINFEVPATTEGYDLLSETDRALLNAREAFFNLLEGVKVLIGLVTCYVSISLVLQTKDDFRFVIPYVEFAKEVRGSRPTILDTSVIVDGRILDILETHVMQGTIIVPKFVLNELQTIADSADKLRRARGRRGLEILQKIQSLASVAVSIQDADAEGHGVDQKLISMAQQFKCRVMTNDYNLNKIATLRGVEVINLNDLAKALRPVVLPGEEMDVKIVKPGEGPTQGVGYLEDGTMVVVEGGRSHIGEHAALTVTSTLQTSAGRMVFGRYDGQAEARDEDEPSQDAGDQNASADDASGSDSTPQSSGGTATGDQAGPAASDRSGAGMRPPRSPSRRNPRRSR